MATIMHDSKCGLLEAARAPRSLIMVERERTIGFAKKFLERSD